MKLFEGYSSAGRAAVSKTAGRGFDPFCPCQVIKTMAKKNPVQFIREVRQEASKVTWPTRRETTISTGMVFVMVILAAAFFFVVDEVLSLGVKLIFGLGA